MQHEQANVTVVLCMPGLASRLAAQHAPLGASKHSANALPGQLTCVWHAPAVAQGDEDVEGCKVHVLHHDLLVDVCCLLYAAGLTAVASWTATGQQLWSCRVMQGLAACLCTGLQRRAELGLHMGITNPACVRTCV